MILNDFNRLDQYKQLDEIMTKGVLLLQSKRYNVHVKLFQLDNFYAEVFSLHENNKVIMINAFENTDYLEPYLAEVDVSALLTA
jgi:hypothetical protein